MNQQSQIPPSTGGTQQSFAHALASDKGVCVWSELMHPIYDAVAEVRAMPDGGYQVWHHYGEGSIPWADEVAPVQPTLTDAIDVIRGYQRAIAVQATARQKVRLNA